MHELSIAMNILNIVEDTCRRQDCGRVDAVFVRIGQASGVMKDALLFAFDHVKGESLAREARLHIEEVPVGGHCAGCGSDFSVEEKYVFECPLCGGRNFSITSGHELEIMELEVDE